MRFTTPAIAGRRPPLLVVAMLLRLPSLGGRPHRRSTRKFVCKTHSTYFGMDRIGSDTDVHRSLRLLKRSAARRPPPPVPGSVAR